MKRVAEADANIIDIVAYPFITELDKVLETDPVAEWGRYRNRLKLGGVKITLDGSPQGRTAFFTTPYLRGGPAGEKDWRGELTFPESTARKMVKRVYELGVPLNVHANGDAAIDVLLRAHELATGHDRSADHHVTLIHGQFARRDQLEKFRTYHITPSFYTLHTYYFAGAHIANRGAEQAAFMSPMRAAVALGLNPTNHTDFVVAPLDQMFMMWSAVNRLSRSGEVIGPDQRLAPLDALKAMTINAAMQYGEQEQKGTLEPGKLADLVILDRNPLEGDPATIKDIGVLETIKEGKTIYKRR
jgi:predicted amidohydrolase YtcJ